MKNRIVKLFTRQHMLADIRIKNLFDAIISLLMIFNVSFLLQNELYHVRV